MIFLIFGCCRPKYSVNWEHIENNSIVINDRSSTSKMLTFNKEKRQLHHYDKALQRVHINFLQLF